MRVGVEGVWFGNVFFVERIVMYCFDIVVDLGFEFSVIVWVEVLNVVD